MDHRIETESLPNGGTIERIYLADRMTGQVQRELSGKVMTLAFNDSNQLVSETHAYMPKLLIVMQYDRGKKTSETYISKNRLITRKSYEKARQAYPDMPPADMSIEDSNADMVSWAHDDRRQRRMLEDDIQDLDPARGADHDAFCEKLMSEGETANVFDWIKLGQHSLGEMDPAESKRWLTRLKNSGCTRALVCKIERYSKTECNTGHLVVELPGSPELRQKTFKFLARLAQGQGYDPTPDDGQRFIYVKLD